MKHVRYSKFIFVIACFTTIAACSSIATHKSQPKPASQKPDPNSVLVTDAEVARVAALENKMRKQYETDATDDLNTLDHVQKYFEAYVRSVYMKGTGEQSLNMGKADKTYSRPLVSYERIPFRDGAAFTYKFLTERSKGTESILEKNLVASETNLPMFFKVEARVDDTLIPLMFVMSSHKSFESETPPFILDFHKLGLVNGDDGDDGDDGDPPEDDAGKCQPCSVKFGEQPGPGCSCRPPTPVQTPSDTPLLYVDPPEESLLFSLPNI